MEQSETILEMLSIITALITATFLIIKFISKKPKKKSKYQVTLNLSNIPEPNKTNLSSKQILMNRLIDYEIKRKPGLSRKNAERIALERLARDNR